MAAPRDNWDAYFADTLWRLMPAIHRTLDTDQYAVNGPLRELTQRIGASAADIRQSFERLWEDQAIETCDPWVIPYIADLVGTRLVAGLDPAAQRRDVANTIAYRRRKGTLAVIEEIAGDVTGWQVKAVEFFRRLARTRHGLDPALGHLGVQPAAGLAIAEGLLGQRTSTPIGGFANLRDVAGARGANTPFDEFCHTADLRVGAGTRGWHMISRLGIFVWRLRPWLITGVTPVTVAGCPGWYCFDPTGRDIALFSRGRDASAAIDNWTSPDPLDIGAAISQTLLDESLPAITVAKAGQGGSALRTSGWGDRIADLPQVGDSFIIAGVEAADPQTGLPTGTPQHFALAAPLTPQRDGEAALVIAPTIATGIGGTVASLPAKGARLTFVNTAEASLYGDTGASRAAIAVHAPGLVAPESLLLRPERGRFRLAAAPAGVTVDYTYGFSSDIGAGPYDRRGQAIALPPASKTPVTIGGGGAAIGAQAATGAITIGDSATYAAANVTVAGGLTIAAANGERPLIRIADGRSWVIHGTAADAKLRLDGLFVAGGDVILTGSFGEVVITCTTFDPGEAAPHGSSTGTWGTAADGRALVPVHLIVTGSVKTLTIDRAILGPVTARDYDAASDPPEAAPQGGETGKGAIEAVTIGNSVLQALRPALPSSPPQSPPPSPPASPPAFPLFSTPVLSFADGTLVLSRCTVLGPVEVHRLTASECLLTGRLEVDDQQEGCVRYSALVPGGHAPRAFACVAITTGGPIFTSTRFGDAGYAHLREDADRQCRPYAATLAAQPTSILTGAADGSEMGAFARDGNPIRARALAIKLQEYMPAGMTPVVINTD